MAQFQHFQFTKPDAIEYQNCHLRLSLNIGTDYTRLDDLCSQRNGQRNM